MKRIKAGACVARRAARGPPGAGNKFGDGLKDGRRWLSWFRLLAPDQGCIVGDLVGPSVGATLGSGADDLQRTYVPPLA